MTQIPRRTVIGKRDGVQPTDEAEHFFKCEACGGWFDTRDLGAVLDHKKPPAPYGMYDVWLGAVVTAVLFELGKSASDFTSANKDWSPLTGLQRQSSSS